MDRHQTIFTIPACRLRDFFETIAAHDDNIRPDALTKDDPKRPAPGGVRGGRPHRPIDADQPTTFCQLHASPVMCYYQKNKRLKNGG